MASTAALTVSVGVRWRMSGDSSARALIVSSSL
jgi:hypothetical protein